MFYTTLDWHWRLCYLSAQDASGASTRSLNSALIWVISCNDLLKQEIELIVEIVKWETRPRSDSNRFLCRHCPAHSLGPSDSTTGRAESCGTRSQSCAGGKFFWARGLRTLKKRQQDINDHLCNVGRFLDHSSTLTGHLNSVVHVIVSSLLPSFICSSFLPYPLNFIHHDEVVISLITPEKGVSCVDLFALSCLESLRMMCPITSSSSSACL